MNLQSLPPADKLQALRQRRALVKQAETRRLTSRAARRRHGPQNPSWLAYTAALRKIVRATWDMIVQEMAPRADSFYVFSDRCDHIEKRGNKWVLLSKKTGEVLGTHD